MTNVLKISDRFGRRDDQSGACEQPITPEADKLRGNILFLPNNRLAAGMIDPYRFRVDFPDLWAAYLRNCFESPEHVAVYFRVTARTAENWLTGVNRPSGDRVAMAAIEDKDRFLKFVGRAA